MMTLEEITDRLSDMNLTAVSKATGIHYNTIRNIKNGENKNPSYLVVADLSNYFTKKEANNNV